MKEKMLEAIEDLDENGLERLAVSSIHGYAIQFRVSNEICGNGKDDDGDGYADCDDLDCALETISGIKAPAQPKSLDDCNLIDDDELLACLSANQTYLEGLGIYDAESSLVFCTELSAILNAPLDEIKEIESQVMICDLYVSSSTTLEPGRLLVNTAYRNPNELDLEHGFNGDVNVIRGINKPFLESDNQSLEVGMYGVLSDASNSSYQPIADKFMQRFISGIGGIYEDSDLSKEIIGTNEVRNKVKLFGEELNELLASVGGDIEQIQGIDLDQSFHLVFGARQGYLTVGPTVLINDTEQINYYLQSYTIDDMGKWQGYFYVEVWDHFGLDNNDPNNRILNIPYQFYHSGFACWWILQHRRNYIPFKTKIKFLVCLEGQI